MYLLDNKTKIDTKILNKIYEVENKNDLLNLLNNKEINGIDLFFEQIKFNFKNVSFYQTETTLNNLQKLFSNPPLSMDKNSEEFQNIVKKYEKNIKYKSGKYNYDIIEDYKKLLMEKIKEGKISSYDIVGDTTRNFNNLFYGKSMITRENMDLFLYEVSKMNPFELNKEKVIMDKDKISKLEKLEKKLNLYKEPNFTNLLLDQEVISVENRLDKIFKSIKENKIFEINNFNAIIKDKQIEIKKLIFKTKSSSEKINELIIETHLRLETGNKYKKENKPTYELFKETLKGLIDGLNDENEKKIGEDYLLSLNEKEDEIKLNTIRRILSIPNFGKLFNNIEKDKPLYNFEQKIKKIKNYLYEDKNNLFNEYKDIKKHYVSITDRDNELFNLKKKYLISKFNENRFKSNIGELFKALSEHKDILKYDLNDIKQLLYIESSDNKTIYDLVKNTSFFNKIENNILIKDILKDKLDGKTINKFNLERIKYVASILINKENLDKLFTNDIRINIKDKFYKLFGTLIEDDLSNSKLNEIYKLFNTYKDEKNYKNLNILLGIILESYENKEFNKNKFEQFFELINNPASKLNEEQKKLFDSIEDKWLKWSVYFNREIKDNNLTYSNINPLDFDFSKMQTIKKIFQEKFDKNDKLTTKDYNLIGFLINEDKNDNINESFDKLKNILDNKKEDLNKKWLNEDEFFNHFYKNIKNIVEYKSLNNFKTQIKNIINNFINADKDNMDIAFTEIFALNKTLEIAKNINFDNNINLDRMFNLVKTNITDKNKNIINFFSRNNIDKLNKLDILENFFENFKSISKLSNEKIDSYINYFETMKKTDSFKNYKEEDSLIPIISKDIGNGYSYKVKTIKEFDILLTGEKTDCCMTINGAGWNIYKYMYENPKSNVIFEVYKDGDPVANSWTWCKDGKICFDNIEVLGKELRENIVKAYQDVALEFVTNYNIQDVNFGIANTKVELNKLGNEIFENISKQHLNCYTDASNQLGVVSLTNNIKNIEVSLMKLREVNNQNLLKKYVDKIKETYNIDYEHIINNERDTEINLNRL